MNPVGCSWEKGKLSAEDYKAENKVADIVMPCYSLTWEGGHSSGPKGHGRAGESTEEGAEMSVGLEHLIQEAGMALAGVPMPSGNASCLCSLPAFPV